MFKRKSSDAQVGDKFVKATDNKSSVWVVEKIFEHVDGIMHARLYNRAHPKTMITVSASTSELIHRFPGQARDRPR